MDRGSSGPVIDKGKTNVQQYDFEESIGYWLTMATQAYHRSLADELAPHGITFRQAQVLGWLALKGDLSQTELARRMMVEPPTLVSILDRMEREGWISRRTCQSDRRRKYVQLNAAAEPGWDRVLESARKIRAQASEGLSDKQAETLKNLLRVVHQNLGTSSAGENCAALEKVV
ncbi:MAG: MarR family transcriptional regulator [Planctomycetota bacterium]|nr:MarR family transcriptional regulator [Planctomycetota bacterium]